MSQRAGSRSFPGLPAAACAAVASLAVASASATAGAQQPAAPGALTGRVVERGTGAPIAAAQVMVVGAPRAALTGDSGTFRLVGVPSGPVTVRVRRLGYASAVEETVVPAGGTARLTLTLGRALAQTLEQVVVTATGEEAMRRERGNTVATIAALPPERLAAVQSFSQLLAGQAPGVQVLQSGGTTGIGARVRIRGANSVSLSNEPLVLVDGVRVNAQGASGTIAVGGQMPSRLNDLNPEDIERVEVLKGPAAAGLFGTQAANGVIQVFTKRGAAGRARWTAWGDAGTLADANAYPESWGAYFTSRGAVRRGCNLVSVAAKQCTQDSTVHFSPLEDTRTTPFRTGQRRQLGLSVGGGSDRATYYLSGEREEEDGIYRTSQLGRSNLRANVHAFFGEGLDAAVNVGYVGSRLFLPENDNNMLGYLSNGMYGFPQIGRGDQGYDPVGPRQIDTIENLQELDRVTGSVQGTWRPATWLRVTGATGMDLAARGDFKTFPVGGVQYADFAVGQRYSNRLRGATTTANLAATATFALGRALTSQTTASFQYQRDVEGGTFAGGVGLTAGTESLDGAISGFYVGERSIESRLAGGLLQQQLGWRDRLYLTAGVRGDDNSAFGRDFATAYYPTAQLSWIASEEGFFPRTRWLQTLQLRAAYGQSGLRPEPRFAMTYFSPTPTRVDTAEVAGVTLAGIGDPMLKPERTTERELGLAATALGGRVSLDASVYHKESRDALVARRTAPSAGVARVAFANLAQVRNRGWEVALHVRPVERRSLVWNAQLSLSANRDLLVDLGRDASGAPVPPIISGIADNQRLQAGYPLAGYWGHRITAFADTNTDGIVDRIAYGDTAEFLGRSMPTRMAGLGTDVTVLRHVRLAAQLDWRGGFRQFNASEETRCAGSRCRGLFDRTAPLAEQARAIASARDGIYAGFVERGDFLKLRELSLTLLAPDAWATRVRARGASLTVAGQNLGTWTDYTGLDPEVNAFGQANFSQADLFSQPQVRRVTARVTLTF